jgi:hypothetical protein
MLQVRWLISITGRAVLLSVVLSMAMMALAQGGVLLCLLTPLLCWLKADFENWRQRQ